MLHRSMLHANEAGCNRSKLIVLIAARNRATENYSQTQLTHTLTKTGLNWSRRTAQLKHPACYTQPKQAATRRLT